MKLTVLGKYGPYPAPDGGTSSYLVQSADCALVLDFGSAALGRLLLHKNISDIRAIVLSHLHYDHICDLLPLSYYLQATGRTVDVVMPNCNCKQRDLIKSLDGINVKFTEPVMRLGDFTLTFEKMVHPLESYSVKVQAAGRTLFYSGDTLFCPQLTEAAKGSDLLLLDCGKAENSAAPHLSLNEAAFISKTLSVPVIASHLNPALSYCSPSPFVMIAEEGKTYEI